MKVAHVIKVLGRPMDTFFYRSVTNPNVQNTIFCRTHQNRDKFPHASVYSTSRIERRYDFVKKILPGRLVTPFKQRKVDIEWERFLDQENPDVIHVQPGDLAVGLIDSLERLQAPLIVTFHGSDINTATYREADYLQKLKRLFERCDAYHFVSHALKDEGLLLGADPDKSQVIYLGTPVAEKLASPNGETEGIRAAVVANLIPCKGHETLLKAWRRVTEKLPQAQLDVIGSGPLRNHLQWLAESLNVQANTKFHGLLPYEQVQRLLATQTDMLICCSQRDDQGAREGLPVCLMEAATSGLPLVGTLCGGIPEIVRQKETGILVNQRDVDGLADAIITLALNPCLRKEMGSAARELALREFDVQAQLGKMQSLYQRLSKSSAYRHIISAKMPPARGQQNAG